MGKTPDYGRFTPSQYSQRYLNWFKENRETIKAHAEGREIEYQSPFGEWCDAGQFPGWYVWMKYRVKQG